MTHAEQTARNILKGQSTERLVEQFELTETSNDKDIYIVRGWLMDELQNRDAEAFDLWIDSDESSPRKFYL